MALDLPSVRAALVVLLGQTPEIVLVDNYEQLTSPQSQLPYVSVRLGPVTRVFEQMGSPQYQADWVLNIALATSQPGAFVAAQQLYETLISRFHNTLDATPNLGLPGVVEWSLLDRSDMPPQPSLDGVWYAMFTLQTFIQT